MREHVESNRRMWDAWTPYNVASDMYDVPGFKAGRDTISATQAAAVGDVAGKSLLHLQCHFGLDTLSWARRGARVTGVDFSPAAIRAARELAAETGIPATFVESDVLELPTALDGVFDVVFTTVGALCWLPDLEAWARVVGHFLAPGGVLFVQDAHPFLQIFDDRRTDGELRLLYPYFHGREAVREEHGGCYTTPDAPIQSVEHVWLHRMDEILGAVLRAGLRITLFAEHPFIAWRFLPWMIRRPEGGFALPGADHLPLMFSLKAVKDGG